MEQLIKWDTSLFLFLNNLGTTTWDGFWLYITNRDSWTSFYVLLCFYLFYKFHWKTSLAIVLIAILGVALSDQVTNLFKHSVERLRPCHQEEIAGIMRLVRDGCGGRFGYYSGHASNHMFLAVYLGLILRKTLGNWVLYSFLIWALAIGYSRIYVGAHFPLDVLSGFVMGGFFGFLMMKLFDYTNQRLNKNKPTNS